MPWVRILRRQLSTQGQSLPTQEGDCSQLEISAAASCALGRDTRGQGCRKCPGLLIIYVSKPAVGLPWGNNPMTVNCCLVTVLLSELWGKRGLNGAHGVVSHLVTKVRDVTQRTQLLSTNSPTVLGLWGPCGASGSALSC